MDYFIADRAFIYGEKGHIDKERLGVFIGKPNDRGAYRQSVQCLFLLIGQVHRGCYRLDITAKLLAEGNCRIGIGESYLAQ